MFSELDMSALNNESFNTDFRNSFSLQMAFSAGTVTSEVDIQEISAGSVVVDSVTYFAPTATSTADVFNATLATSPESIFSEFEDSYGDITVTNITIAIAVAEILDVSTDSVSITNMAGTTPADADVAYESLEVTFDVAVGNLEAEEQAEVLSEALKVVWPTGLWPGPMQQVALIQMRQAGHPIMPTYVDEGAEGARAAEVAKLVTANPIANLEQPVKAGTSLPLTKMKPKPPLSSHEARALRVVRDNPLLTMYKGLDEQKKLELLHDVYAAPCNEWSADDFKDADVSNPFFEENSPCKEASDVHRSNPVFGEEYSSWTGSDGVDFWSGRFPEEDDSAFDMSNPLSGDETVVDHLGESEHLERMS
eukprot:gene29613-36900_t